MKYHTLIASLFLLYNCATTQNLSLEKEQSKITYTNKPLKPSATKTTPNSATTEEKKTMQPIKRLYYYSILLDRFESKKEADLLVTDFKKNFPKSSIKIRYERPRYKVYTGTYSSEESADKAAQNYRKLYKGAFSVQFKN